MHSTEGDGYLIIHHAIPRLLTEGLRRRMYLEVRRHGLTVEDAAQESAALPHVRWTPEVAAVREAVYQVRPPTPGVDCEPQLIVRWPADEPAATEPLYPHLDESPPWATGTQRYNYIAGVMLSNASLFTGGPYVMQDGHIVPLNLGEGDVLFLESWLPHANYLNQSADPRLAVYFRRLTLDTLT